MVHQQSSHRILKQIKLVRITCLRDHSIGINESLSSATENNPTTSIFRHVHIMYACEQQKAIQHHNIYILYSGKLSREKTFTNFIAMHLRKLSPRNFRHTTPIYAINYHSVKVFFREMLPSYRFMKAFSPSKVSRYMVNRLLIRSELNLRTKSQLIIITYIQSTMQGYY